MNFYLRGGDGGKPVEILIGITLNLQINLGADLKFYPFI